MRAKEFLNENLAWRIRFKRFSDMDPLLPEREGKMYFMPLDTSSLKTYYNLTGKNFDKISKMPTEVYEIPGDSMVGDMDIINDIHTNLDLIKRTQKFDKYGEPEVEGDPEDFAKENKKLKQKYLKTMVPYSKYRPGMFKYPEILVDPSSVKKIEDKGVTYDKNTGQIKLTKRNKVTEAPLPPDWDPEQLNLRQTFKNRLKYALDRAKRLGGGSSRVAMIIDYEGRPTALKVAKNLKGLAQNEAEIEILEDFYVGQLPIVIPLIDYDKANKRPVWLQTEIAKKVQAPTLMKMLHTPSMWLLTNQVRNITGNRKPHEMDDAKLKKVYFETHNNLWKPTEEDYKIFRQYAEELAELVSSSTLETGDLQSPANWGIYNGRPVVIDLGFTGETKGLYGYKE